MKKTIQILFFSALSIAGFAQSKTGPVVNAKDVRKASREISDYEKSRRSTPNPVEPSSSSRVVVFEENFNNGFSGNNGVGNWTTSHMLSGVPSTQGSMWRDNGDPTYVNVLYGSNTALASATPNRYVIWDGGQYETDWPNSLPSNSSSYTAFLNAPALDFSALSTVQVEFLQLFSWGYRFISPLTIDVRVGNGAWESFNAAPGESVYALTQTDNPLKSVVDISCVAAGQSNVQIRFAFNTAEEWGQSGVFWCIDDIKIYDNTIDNDLRVTAITNGDITNAFEYRATPMEQRIPQANGGVSVGAYYQNKGTETIEGANFKIEFFLGAETTAAHTYNSDPFTVYSSYDPANPNLTCPVDSGATLFSLFQTGFYPENAGLYNLKVTLELPDGTVDEHLADNVFSKKIRFTSNAEFGHDRDTLNWYMGSSSAGGGMYNQNGWGNMFQFNQPGSVAHGVTVRFGPSTAADVQFNVHLKKLGAGQSIDTAPEVGSATYDTRTGWNTGAPLYFAFNDPNVFTDPKPALPYGPVPVDTLFFAAVHRPQSGAGNFSVFISEDEDDYDFSSYSLQALSDNQGTTTYEWFYTYDYAPAVRLVLSNQNHVPIAVEETETPLASFLVYPNPAVNEARVSFNLKESSYIAYEVRDLQGRLMDTDNVGRFSTGENSFSLNVSKYPAGNYIVGLVVEGAQIFTQQISVVR